MNKKTGIIIGIIIIIALAIIIPLISSKNYLQEISLTEAEKKIENQESFILYVMSTDCTHCKSFSPKLKDVLNKYKITAYKIDISKIDDEKGINSLVNIGGTPTVVFYEKGEELDTYTRMEGDIETEKIIQKLKSTNYIK